MAELPVTAIRWTLEPVTPDPLEDDSIVDAWLDAMAYRTVLQESLHALAALAREYDRLARCYYAQLEIQRNAGRTR